MTISSLNIIVPLKNEEKSVDNLIQNLMPILQKIEKLNTNKNKFTPNQIKMYKKIFRSKNIN